MTTTANAQPPASTDAVRRGPSRIGRNVPRKFTGDSARGAISPSTRSQASGEYIVSDEFIEWIPAGIRIGKKPPKGWTHLVYVSHPRIAAGDVDALPDFGAKLASAFSLACIANARPERQGQNVVWRLEKVAVGLGYKTGRVSTVVRSTSASEFGVNLSFFEKTLLGQQEKIMRSKDTVQIVKGPNLYVCDAKAVLRLGGKNRILTLRQAIVLSPNNGGLGCLVWFLDEEGEELQMIEQKMRFLPSSYHEDRALYVDASKFRLGFPGPDAIAMLRPPHGKPLPISNELRKLAQMRRYTAESAQQLENGLWQLLGQAGVKK